MLKITCFAVTLSFFSLIPIAVLASEQQKPIPQHLLASKNPAITLRGKIYMAIKPSPEARCNKKLITVTLSRAFKNPNYNPSHNNEQYIYKNVASSNSQNNDISGDIKRGYCEYTLRVIPKIKGNYQLTADVDIKQSDIYFPVNAPGCTVSPVFGEPIAWKNPLSISSLDKNKDFELTRVVAKCDPSIPLNKSTN